MTIASQTANESVSFKIPESIISRKLAEARTFSATIAINGETPTVMTISSTTASATLNKVSKGSTTFTIIFTFDHDSFEPLVIGTATKTLDVTTGDNSLSCALADFDFSIDGDGISKSG